MPEVVCPYTIRGAIPRRVIRTVTRATYLQPWWPPFDHPVYTDPDRFPAWDAAVEAYRDVDTGFPLPTWEEALDELDADQDARVAVMLKFGAQVDIAGIIAPSPDADRSIRYLTKSVAETYTNSDPGPGVRGAHRPAPCPGPLVAVRAGVCELAALRHPTEERRARTGPRHVRIKGT